MNPLYSLVSIDNSQQIIPSDKNCNKIREDNPHIQQLPETETIQIKPLTALKRILESDAPKKEYHRRADEKKSVIHWGQRKLLLSEIEFLTQCAQDHDTVVYAGAAPGTHISYLVKLFPTLKFILIDPSDFVVGASPPTIEIRQTFFTDQLAQEFAGRSDVLFISDIRSADWRVLKEEEVEDEVEQNQLDQMRWHVIINPKYSMLKFRLPWGQGYSYYLDGDIYLPIWGPKTTTETRLIVGQNAKLKKYDHTTYEQQLFYFNTCTRVGLYDHVKIEVPGLCSCYDCSAEIIVILDYLYKMGKHLLKSQLQLCDELAKMINEITKECSPQSTRTLASSVIPKFKPRKFDTSQQSIFDAETVLERNLTIVGRGARGDNLDKILNDPILSRLVI